MKGFITVNLVKFDRRGHKKLVSVRVHYTQVYKDEHNWRWGQFLVEESEQELKTLIEEAEKC